MSRTKRKMKGIIYNDGKDPFYKCRCEWCVEGKWRNRRKLSIKESLKLES